MLAQTPFSRAARVLDGALPITRDLSAARVASWVVAALVAGVSIAGLMLGTGGLYGEPRAAIGPATSTAGVLVPGFWGQDVFNLLVGLPLLLWVLWRASRGSVLGLLLWPGALVYLVYTYASYLLAAPFSGLFLAYVALVALSALTTIGLIESVDAQAVRDRLAARVPARPLGGLLVGLALLTFGQDAVGALVTAFASQAPASLGPRAVWTVDLTLEVPIVLLGGTLLWRRAPLGYLVAPGLLLQYGLTPLAIAAGLLLEARLGGAAVNVSTVLVLLAFGAVSLAPLVLFAQSPTWARVLMRAHPRVHSG